MSSIDLNHLAPGELPQLLDSHSTIVACLCAEWCDVCKTYRPRFEALASQYPELLFIWIDIEDQAALVDHLEVDNFPTLLIQQHDIVSFYGVMQPDTMRLNLMIQSQARQSEQLRQQQAQSDELQRSWQGNANLRTRLSGHV